MPIKKSFNKSFFKKWSSDMAYVLGFLFADGNIIKTKRDTYFIGFYSADYDLICSIAKSMSADHKISKRKSKFGNGYSLQIGSKELFNDLLVYGLTSNKTKCMILPKIPKKYIGSFVCGYFDGDGNVWSGYINKNRKNPTSVLSLAFTCASNNFLISLKELLLSLGCCGGSIYFIKNKNCSRLQYSTLDALKLYKIMYNGSHRLFLRRKKSVFDKFIKMRP